VARAAWEARHRVRQAPLPPARPPSGARISAGRRAAPWLLLWLGLSAAAVGSGLLIASGTPACELEVGQRRCPERWNMVPVGVPFLTVGGAVLAGWAVFLGVDWRTIREPIVERPF
jgi:hypothetical protein